MNDHYGNMTHLESKRRNEIITRPVWDYYTIHSFCLDQILFFFFNGWHLQPQAISVFNLNAPVPQLSPEMSPGWPGCILQVHFHFLDNCSKHILLSVDSVGFSLKQSPKYQVNRHLFSNITTVALHYSLLYCHATDTTTTTTTRAWASGGKICPFLFMLHGHTGYVSNFGSDKQMTQIWSVYVRKKIATVRLEVKLIICWGFY